MAEQETELAADTVGPEAAPVDQQQQLALAKQPKPRPEQPAAPIEVHATSASPAVPGRLQVAAPAASDTEVFYDAQEASSADLVLQTLLKELHQAKQDRQEANRYASCRLHWQLDAGLYAGHLVVSPAPQTVCQVYLSMSGRFRVIFHVRPKEMLYIQRQDQTEETSHTSRLLMFAGCW